MGYFYPPNDMKEFEQHAKKCNEGAIRTLASTTTVTKPLNVIW
jgi:hypothetical protein